MMNHHSSHALLNWLSLDEKHVILADNDSSITTEMLREAVAEKQNVLQKLSAKQCLVYRHDSAEFISDFLACVYSGVDIVMPPNAQAKTYKRFKTLFDVSLDDVDNNLVSSDGESKLQAVPHDIQITLFTSGSTGESKAIVRRLSQLLAEVDTLEQLWGGYAQNAIILSTVSHQHIYGFLFKVLWGICYGHTIWRKNVPFEENLYYLMDNFSKSLLVSSPAFLTRMLGKSNHSNRLSCVFSSGGALSQNQAKQVENHLQAGCIRIFGSTETGGVAYQVSTTNEWTAFPKVELRQRENTLEISSPYCYQQPWFTMSDKVELLDNNRFLLMGRVDDVVKVEEKRISLKEVENKLCEHHWVIQARVLLLPMRRRCLGAVLKLSFEGEKKQAENPRLFYRAIRAFLNGYFEDVTLPKHFRCVKEFPEDAQGKMPIAKLLMLFGLENLEKATEKEI